MPIIFIWSVTQRKPIFLQLPWRQMFACCSWNNPFVASVFDSRWRFQRNSVVCRVSWEVSLVCALMSPARRLNAETCQMITKGCLWAETEGEQSHRMFLLALGGSNQPGTTFTWLLPQQNSEWKGSVYGIRLALQVSKCTCHLNTPKGSLLVTKGSQEIFNTLLFHPQGINSGQEHVVA